MSLVSYFHTFLSPFWQIIILLILSRVFFKSYQLIRRPKIHCFMNHERDDWHLQQATGRIPPGYDPGHERKYPFRTWLIDLQLWRVATDAAEHRHGPMVAIRLHGAARELVRELDANTLSVGRNIPDPAGGMQPIHQTGLEYLVAILTRNFAPLAQEIQLGAIHELFSFRKQHGDNYDECITRFELMCHRVELHGNLQLPTLLRSYMLLNALHFPREKWTILLAPTLGMLPADDIQYQAFLSYVRQSGHLVDGTLQQNISGMQRYHYVEPVNTSQQSYWQNHNSYASPATDWPTGWQTTPSTSSYGLEHVYYDAEEVAEEELSSGHSNAESEIEYEDIAHLPFNSANEALYLAYRGAKRRFRGFSKSGPRKGKGKGRRKGKGKGFKGKGKPMFYADGSPVEDQFESGYEADNNVVFETYYQKGGKGGKSKGGIRKNPIGADGKVMLCSGCDSDMHFIKHCPKGKGKGNKSKGTFAATSSSTGHFLATAVADRPTSRISYFDGSFELIPHAESVSTDSAVPETAGVPRFLHFFSNVFVFTWWLPNLAFHALVRLTGSSREGLLIDCGAVGNLAGDKWVKRTSDIAKAHGQGTTFKATAPSSVEGVGTGAAVVNQIAVVPVCLQNGAIGSFETSMVSDSELPALMGLQTLTKNRALIDIANKRLVYVGHGGYDLKLSPGSVTMQLEQVASGHLLLPCSEWAKLSVKPAEPPRLH